MDLHKEPENLGMAVGKKENYSSSPISFELA